MLEDKILEELKGKTIDVKFEHLGLQYIGLLKEFDEDSILLQPSIPIEALPGKYGSQESKIEYISYKRRNLLAKIPRKPWVIINESPIYD